MKPVRLGIIGCGVIGKFHLRTAKEAPELIELVAVADLRENVAKAAAQEFGARKAYVQGTALLDDSEVEAVVLAMPANVRTELALEAFARGKHVLTEKPVAVNASEVRRMIEAKGSLVGACCSSRMRHFESARVVTEFIRAGNLGQIRNVHCRAFSPAGPKPSTPPPPWRLKKSMNGGGILMNWGCYDLDYLLGLCDWKMRPRKVFAQTWPIAPHLEGNIAPESDAETHYAALIRCEDGAVISLERGEYMAIANENAWQVIGTQGSLRLNMTGKEKTVWHDRADAAKGLVSEKLWEGVEDGMNIHRGPAQDFAKAIRENRDPMTTLEEALIVQEISDAIYASANRGEVVEI